MFFEKYRLLIYYNPNTHKAMKNIRLILLGVLTLAFATANAQLKIEKRKHLKGYSIERIGRGNHVNDMKIEKGDRVTAAEVAKMDEKNTAVEESKVVVRPVAYSAAITAADEAPAVAPVKVSPVKPATVMFSKFSFLPKGAGLSMDHNLNVAKQKVRKVMPAAMAGPGDIFAIIGFVAGILSILSFLGPGLIFFGVVGVIFSLLGMDSSYGNFAQWGLILSIIGLLLALIYLLAWAAWY